MIFTPRCNPLSKVSIILAIFLSSALSPAISRAENSSAENLRALALQLVNQSRSEHNLPPLTLETKLTKAAQFHAGDMLKRNYYDHASPEGQTVSGRFQAAGGNRWLLTAENIAKCDGCKPPLTKDYVRQMHKGWMNSPGHRANILHKGLETFGYGITVSKDGRLYAVQTFAGPGTSEATSSTADTRPLSGDDQAQAALKTINTLRAAAGRTRLKLSASLSSAARSMLPRRGEESFEFQKTSDLYNALPDGSEEDWESLTLLSAACGGCGSQPVGADIDFFANLWLGDKKYKDILLASNATHLGFAIAANGKGKKLSTGLLGKHR